MSQVDLEVIKRGEKGEVAFNKAELLNLKYTYMWSRNYKPLAIADSAFKALSDEQKSVVEGMRLEQLGKSGFRVEKVIPFPNFVPIQLSTTIEDNALHTRRAPKGDKMVDIVREDVVNALRKAYKGFTPAEEFNPYVLECFQLWREVCERQKEEFISGINKDPLSRPTIQTTIRKSKRWTDAESVKAVDILYRHFGPTEAPSFKPLEIPSEDMKTYEAEIEEAQKEQGVDPKDLEKKEKEPNDSEKRYYRKNKQDAKAEED